MSATSERTVSRPQTAVPRRRWWIGILLGSGILVNYFDRIKLSVAGPQLQQTFGLTPAELGWPFMEGGDLHPAANVEKMRSGHPLNDQDRQPWLEAVAGWIDERLAAGESGLITCSNLKRAYRRITVGNRKGVTLVYLQGDEPLTAGRISQRKHRYMPASLLHSQFETLEEPAEDEHAVVVPLHGSVAETVIDLLHKVATLQGHGCAGDVRTAAASPLAGRKA